MQISKPMYYKTNTYLRIHNTESERNFRRRFLPITRVKVRKFHLERLHCGSYVRLVRFAIIRLSSFRSFFYPLVGRYISSHVFTLFKISENVALGFFYFWHFPPIFVLLELTCLVTLFDRRQQNGPFWRFFN